MHRINLGIHYDKILVLKQGHVAEFGPPDDLLNDPESEFASMMVSV